VSNALVIACVQRVTSLEWSEKRLLFVVYLLLGECNVCTVSCKIRVEGSALANRVRPRLLAVDNLAILLSVLVTALILLALPRVLRVAHLIQICERLCLDTSSEFRSTVWNGTLRRSQRDVFKLRLANLFVRTGREWLLLLGLSALATKTAIVLAWILVRITERVTLESSKGLLVVLATVNSHAFVETNFVTLLAERLIVGTSITDSQTDRHGEERITLPKLKQKTVVMLVKGFQSTFNRQ